MRNWWKWARILAGGLVSLGCLHGAASAQFPQPNGSGPGMMPGMMGGMGMPGMGGAPPPGAFGGGVPNFAMPAEFPNPAVPNSEPVSPFSIKDEGFGGAFTELVDPRVLRPLRFQIDAGYTFLWFNPAEYPPLATTGIRNSANPGASGQPGTALISTGPDSGPNSAFRVGATYWICDPECLSIEGTFFLMEQSTFVQDYVSDQNGSPVLARPFFNAQTRNEDAARRALPGVIRGTMQDAFRTRLMGAEAHFKYYGGHGYRGASINLLAGMRWLRLDERYQSFDTLIDLAGINSATFSDNFSTRNQFYGGQVGVDWQLRLHRFLLDLSAKVAVGPNSQRIGITGETSLINRPTGVTVTGEQGFFAQPTNRGDYSSTTTSVLPEFGAKLSFDLNDHVKINVGYTYLFMTNTVRPGDQMDRTITVQPLVGGPLQPLLPGPPVFRQSTFQAHMLNIGVELVF